MNSQNNNDLNKIIIQLLDEAARDGISKQVVGGIVRSGNRIILLRRCSGEFLEGLIELPSGSIDSGETMTEALAREIKEETNLSILEIDKFVSSFDYLSSSGKKTRQFNFLVTIDNNADNEVVLNPTEHDWFTWIEINEIGALGLNLSTETLNVLLSIKY